MEDYEKEELKSHLTEYVNMITKPDPKAGKRHYICPLCGSGSHGGRKSDGAFSIQENGRQWKCFACNEGGDLFTLIEKYEGLTDFKDQAQRAQELFGTVQSRRQDKGGTMEWDDTIEDGRTRQNAPDAPQSHESPAGDNLTAEDVKTPVNANESVKRENTPGKYKEKIQEAAANVSRAADYLHGRGLNDRTIAQYFLGYSAEYFPKAGRELPAVVFPYNTECSYYSARSLDGKFFKKPKTEDAGEEPLYNPAALYGDRPVFICEGAIDALSIIQSGGRAVALIGTAYQKLLDQVDRRRPAQPLILFLDHDEPDEQGRTPGQESQAKLAGELKKRGVVFIAAVFDYDNYQGKHKDANDLLQTNSEQLKADVARITAEAEAAADAAKKPDNVRTYIDTLMSDEIEQFSGSVRKTGYENLDELSTGLYPGLYICAAISSLGKTTFCHQLADQLGAAGHDVLFFSLEMSRLEMVTKSLARIMAQHDLETAVTSLSIRKGFLPQNVIEAAQEYKQKVGDRISIIEGNFDCDIDYIREQIKGYIDRNDTRPIIIIDYLQIVQPADTRQTTKETVDMTVTQLKRMSREYGLTIIAICSVNRASYAVPISFESLKESGNIEFSADVIYGLQLHCLSEPMFENEKDIIKKRERINEAKAEEPRKIDLICLKNRYGIANFTCTFNYYAANDLFVPVGNAKAQKARPKNIR